MTLTGQARRDAMDRLVAHVEEHGLRETYATLANRYQLSKASVSEALVGAGLAPKVRGKRDVTLPELPEGLTL